VCVGGNCWCTTGNQMTSSIRRHFLHSTKCRRNNFDPGFAHFLLKGEKCKLFPILLCKCVLWGSVFSPSHPVSCFRFVIISVNTSPSKAGRRTDDGGERDVWNVNIYNEMWLTCLGGKVFFSLKKIV